MYCIFVAYYTYISLLEILLPIDASICLYMYNMLCIHTTYQQQQHNDVPTKMYFKFKNLIYALNFLSSEHYECCACKAI